MTPWTFYPVFLATIVSIIGLSHLAITRHNPTNPLTLSELAAAEQLLLARFRNILLFCGILFAFTIFGFIVQRISQPAGTAFFGVCMVVGELIASMVPALHKTRKIHTLMAQLMAVGMLGLAVIFLTSLSGSYQLTEGVCTLIMSASSGLTFLDKRRFLVYELTFIFSSHFSIVVAALALN